ncbi:membrane protein [Mycolicibacterium wolinskyi]|uniref:Membrane protein n=1 Tax=Mycolicibacterium wolinskyi TaxID=59750 RepID=A0A132PJJ8_9MYCO|nr:hypothetical protein [Mycolicibacterium wolinskyi]KWX22518.1 membrane protein [Mycolicibacterium wolinskyi]
MSAPQQSDIRTRVFARVLGPYLIIVTITALARAADMPSLLSQFGENSVWPWVTGAFVLLSGLVVVALHPYWRGVSAIVVSVVGWLTTLKGLFLLAIPQTYLSFGDSMVSADVWWKAIMVVMALVGLYLTYVGWSPAGYQPIVRTRRQSAPDLPRAA